MTRTADVFEKLGLFYLGSPIDDDDSPLLYDSRDLLTHAICVGMTGSGKTGLGIGLLEEAAMDDVPAIIIDPKGDLGNLLLTFPELAPSDFEEWIDVEAARRKGMTAEEYAVGQSELWKNGLESWGQDASRVARLRAKVDMAIYTPGSSAGLPVSIVDSFAAPPPSVREDAEVFGDRIEASATSILALVGIAGDPLQTPEHVFLSNLLSHVWSRGKDLDLAGLITAIQRPPMQKIGVMPVDDVFGPKDRTELAMKINSLVASPGFAAWLEGQPLDIDKFLWTPEGKPRLAIFSIAHLAESERMFFVSLLLQRLLGWVRSQPGSSSLRALLYMDEIFGYVPPVAQPPSKKPIMTLLKQARAFGLGVVLATQNPADIDYKAISNAGTWFLGRLQTERDVSRVLDGLEAASASASSNFDRSSVSRTLAGLEGRQFLLHNVHDDAPVVFKTRWVMSYLRGPLTRADIKRLMADRAPDSGSGASALPPTEAPRGPTEAAVSTTSNGLRPPPVDGVDEAFMKIARPRPGGARPGGAGLIYRPMLYGLARVRFDEPRRNFVVTREAGFVCGFDDGPVIVDWTDGYRVDMPVEAFQAEPPADGEYVAPPDSLMSKSSFSDQRDAYERFLYENDRYPIPACPTLGLEADAGETEVEFRARRDAELRRRRDDAVDQARDRWKRKLQSAEDRVHRAEQKVVKEVDDVSRIRTDAAMDVGGALLSSFFGRRRSSIGRVSRGVSRNMKEERDVARAEADLAHEMEKYRELEAEMRAELDALADEWNPLHHPVGTTFVEPDKDDIDIRYFVLAWVPYWQLGDGERVRAC